MLSASCTIKDTLIAGIARW